MILCDVTGQMTNVVFQAYLLLHFLYISIFHRDYHWVHVTAMLFASCVPPSTHFWPKTWYREISLMYLLSVICNKLLLKRRKELAGENFTLINLHIFFIIDTFKLLKILELLRPTKLNSWENSLFFFIYAYRWTKWSISLVDIVADFDLMHTLLPWEIWWYMPRPSLEMP